MRKRISTALAQSARREAVGSLASKLGCDSSQQASEPDPAILKRQLAPEFLCRPAYIARCRISLLLCVAEHAQTNTKLKAETGGFQNFE